MQTLSRITVRKNGFLWECCLNCECIEPRLCLFFHFIIYFFFALSKNEPISLKKKKRNAWGRGIPSKTDYKSTPMH